MSCPAGIAQAGSFSSSGIKEEVSTLRTRPVGPTFFAALFAAFICLLSRNLQAADNPFPMYPALAANVSFWENIFSQYDCRQAVLHDRNNLAVIYRAVRLQSGGDKAAVKANRRKVEAVRARYRQMLLRMARGRQPASFEERRLLGMFGAGVSPDTLEKAAENIRVQQGLRGRFRQGISRSGAWLGVMRRAFREEGVPEDLVYLAHVESSFNSRARSKSGAAGLWQFTAACGRRFLNIDEARDERYSPRKATRAAARFLLENYRLLGSWPLAITAYNHGPNGMLRASAAHGDLPEIIEKYGGSTFGFASRNFYAEFLAARKVAANYAEYFTPVRSQRPEPVRQLVMTGHVDLRRLAAWLNLDAEVIMAFNPDLREAVRQGMVLIPEGHVLNLPGSSSEVARLAINLPLNLFSDQPGNPRFYRVRSGDTMADVAGRLGMDLETLNALNPLAGNGLLYSGQYIRVPAVDERPVLLAREYKYAVAGNRLAEAAASSLL